MTIETRESTGVQGPEQVPQAAQDVATRMKQAVEPLRAQLSSAYTTAQQKSSEALSNVETHVRRAPLKALAYTAGLTAILAIIGTALLSRKSKKSSGDADS